MGNGDKQIGMPRLLHSDCAGKGNCNCDKCCSTHTVLPTAGPPDPAAFCANVHGSTFQSGTGACARYWTKINSTCTAADYLEIQQCKYIGLRRPKTEPVTIIPEGIITPIQLTDVRVDSTATHTTAANGLILPCKGVWNIAARLWFKHPLEPTEPPVDPGAITEDAEFSIFIGRNGGYSYAREFSPAQVINPLWIPVQVDRTECLGQNDIFTISAYWEDPSSDEVQELEVVVASLTAEFICYCDGVAT